MFGLRLFVSAIIALGLVCSAGCKQKEPVPAEKPPVVQEMNIQRDTDQPESGDLELEGSAGVDLENN